MAADNIGSQHAGSDLSMTLGDYEAAADGAGSAGMLPTPWARAEFKNREDSLRQPHKDHLSL